MAEQPSLPSLASRLCRELAGEDEALTHVDHVVLRRLLTRVVFASSPGLTGSQVEEVVDAAVTRFVEAAKEGRVDCAGHAGAYLAEIARNLSYDLLHREARIAGRLEDEGAEELVDEDAIVRALSNAATKEALREALRNAAGQGDHQLVKVVAKWLVLCETTGRRPSSRDVADALGMSHMTVQRALDRLRSHLEGSGSS